MRWRREEGDEKKASTINEMQEKEEENKNFDNHIVFGYGEIDSNRSVVLGLRIKTANERTNEKKTFLIEKEER